MPGGEGQPAATVSKVTEHHVDEMIDTLCAEFAEEFTREEITQVMADSVQRLAVQARVEEFLPVLAYRYTRERLKSVSRASARQEGTWDVVYVSLSGSGRAQLAAALTGWLTDGSVTVHAAGTGAGHGVDDAVAEVIEELGIDVSEAFARPASPEVLRAADVIVTMGHSVGEVEIPEGVRRLDWRVGDPVGADVDEARRVRGDIEQRVRALLEELGAPVREDRTAPT
jgi:arsenate reductase (thioredoxin)